MTSIEPIFFATAADFRRWLEKNHAKAKELWVGFYKKSSGKAGMTYGEAIDEALCFGWIDGRIRRLDDARYMHRFSPRQPASIWSNINVAHVARLTAAGRMRPSGQAAFAARRAEKTGVYSFETAAMRTLGPEEERRFRADPKAWAFFQAQPPGYRRWAVYKVVSPKQPATRRRWLQRLIAESAAGRRLAPIGTSPTARDRSPLPTAAPKPSEASERPLRAAGSGRSDRQAC